MAKESKPSLSENNLVFSKCQRWSFMEKKIGFIGLGSMGGMLVRGFISTGATKEENVFISTKSKEKLTTYKQTFPKVRLCQTNSELAKQCDCIFICVKPLEVKGILDEIKGELSADTHIISIAACVTLSNLENIFDGQITKVIPSLTSEVREGSSLVCHNAKVSNDSKVLVEDLLGKISKVKIIPESDFELGADLTSCAPGLISAIFSEFVKSAMRHKSDFSKKEIEEMVVGTLLGTAKILSGNNITFEELVSRVATKGGITQEGVSVLERYLPEVFDRVFNATLNKHRVVKEKITTVMNDNKFA